MKKKLVLLISVCFLSAILYACSFPDSPAGVITEAGNSETLLAQNSESSEPIPDTEEEKPKGKLLNTTPVVDSSKKDTSTEDTSEKAQSKPEDKSEEKDSKENKDKEKKDNKDKADSNKKDKADSDKNDEEKTEQNQTGIDITDQEEDIQTSEKPSEIVLTEEEKQAQEEAERIALEQAEAQRLAAEAAAAAEAEAERLAAEQAAASAPAGDEVSLMNAARAEAGLGPLTYDATLNALAYQRAVEISTCWGHNRPDGSICFSILDQNGVDYRSCGENIAAGHESAVEVVNSWLNSPGHRANILNGAYNKMGLAVYYGGEYGTYWVQIFTN